jgi:N-acetylmuramoyl-L-alanine amidase
MNWNDWYTAVLALVIWREARGEGTEGMRAVAHVIRNRVVAGAATPGDWGAVIERKWQFSSLTAPGDSQLVQWPAHPDAGFEQAMAIAARVFAGTDQDPTGGASHYCNLSLCHPAWAQTLTETAKIGRHTFFK